MGVGLRPGGQPRATRTGSIARFGFKRSSFIPLRNLSRKIGDFCEGFHILLAQAVGAVPDISMGRKKGLSLEQLQGLS